MMLTRPTALGPSSIEKGWVKSSRRALDDRPAASRRAVNSQERAKRGHAGSVAEADAPSQQPRIKEVLDDAEFAIV